MVKTFNYCIKIPSSNNLENILKPMSLRTNASEIVKEQLTKTVGSITPLPEVLKFINDNRQLDLTAFYEKIRKSA